MKKRKSKLVLIVLLLLVVLTTAFGVWMVLEATTKPKIEPQPETHVGSGEVRLNILPSPENKSNTGLEPT